ncbi:GGDEF domain-containing protein [Tannockella kyphosi]|uniref:GGDEF domain-containing protein n=1 Tax=Tannockella kyphosi TaxID=2899121 RepID=UPI002012D745|nr:diguanylate cyclase [Tannockella kyphosi]
MSKSQTGIRKLIARVDIQVSIIVFLFTFIATLTTSIIYWNFTFQVMMVSLEERVYALYDAVEETLDMDTFLSIDSIDDMDTTLYQEAKDSLLQMKNSAGVLYLYTAKEDASGNFIYVIDGLESDQDFRIPGDAIETEIIEDMQRALSGEYVLPDGIVHTDWGDIFVAYFPVHDDTGAIIGVLGIEFDASEIYETYQNLIGFVPLIITLLSILASIVSISIFKRISNPLYMDMATQDLPTGLKNRNAFDVDLNNLSGRGSISDIGIITADINHLKKVNDELGHSAGDDYIRLVGDCIKESMKENMVAYRIGGDEFLIIVKEASDEKLIQFMNDCSSKISSQTIYPNMECSISIGACVYDKKIDQDLEDTCLRADELMYQHKKQ